jgi:hypothetical protein
MVRALTDQTNAPVHAILDGPEPPVRPVTTAFLIHVCVVPVAVDKVDTAVSAPQTIVDPLATNKL